MPMLAVTNSSAPSTIDGRAISARSRSAISTGDTAGADVAQHDDELVAAEAAEHVAVADDRPQALAHAAQQLVADPVTEAVVDDLEVVEVDEQHGDRRRARWSRGIGASWSRKLDAVRQPGQLVVGRRPLQLLGAAALLGDVLDVGDRQLALAVVHHRHPVRAHITLWSLADVALLHVVRVGADPQPCASRHAPNRRDA